MSSETADAPEPEISPMSRRALLRRSGAVAAGGVAAGGLGAQYAVQDAEAVAPLAVVAGVAGAAVVADTAYQMYHSGGSPDEEDILGAIQFEDHLEGYNRFREWWQVENEVQLASFRNDISNFGNQVLNTGIRRVYAGALEGETEADAIAAAKSDMDTEADELAEWIVSWFNARILSSAVSKLNENDAARVKKSTESSYGDLFDGPWTSSDNNYPQPYTVPSGSGTVPTAAAGNTNGSVIALVDYNGNLASEGDQFYDGASGSEVVFEMWALEPDPDDYSFSDSDEYDAPEDFDSWEHVDGDQQGLDAGSYVNLLSDLEDALSTAKTDLDNRASAHFQEMQDREISLSELLTPSGLLETAGEGDTAHEAALFFRAQEMPQGSEAVVVEFDVPEDLQGEVGQETITAEGYLGWSVAQAGDTLPVGQEITPDNYLGRIYFATQYVGENDEMTGDVLEMTGPFTIVSTDSGSTPLEFEEPAAMPDADTDPAETIDIFTQNRDSEEDARDHTIEVVTGGDSGGWNWPSLGLGSWFGIPGWVYAAAGIAVAWRVSQDDS